MQYITCKIHSQMRFSVIEGDEATQASSDKHPSVGASPRRGARGFLLKLAGRHVTNITCPHFGISALLLIPSGWIVRIKEKTIVLQHERNRLLEDEASDEAVLIE